MLPYSGGLTSGGGDSGRGWAARRRDWADGMDVEVDRIGVEWLG